LTCITFDYRVLINLSSVELTGPSVNTLIEANMLTTALRCH